MKSIVYNTDCLEAMRQMPDKAFDLCVTSPPYNLGENHHTGNFRFMPYNDNLPETEYQDNQITVLSEMYRIFSDGGSVFYNHKNRIRNGVQISPYEWLTRTPWTIKQEIVWFNGSQNFDKVRFYPMTERIWWLSKGTDTRFYNHINHHDLFYWQAEGTSKQHKRAFPLEMVKDLLRCYPTTERVIDPYLGSGSSRIAAYDLGFDFTGYELDADYFNAQEERFQNHISQARLFDAPILETLETVEQSDLFGEANDRT